MKILIVNQHPDDVIGGSEIQCDIIANQLTQLGHEVVYFAVNGQQCCYETSYRVIPGTLPGSDLRQALREYAPDVVYWRFNKRKFLPAALMIKRMGVKLVFAISHINDVIKWSHKVRFDAVSLKGKIIQRYCAFRSSLASRINHLGFFWVDGVIAQLRQQTGFLPVRKETIIPNSVDARSTPFTWEKPFVIWAASIKPAKNPELFFELAARCRDQGVDFLMVGPVVSSRYNALLRDAQTLSNFYYLGDKPYYELNGIIRQSLFLVHTCEPEGFPNVFIQAWIQGKPTVSVFYDPDNMIQEQQLGAYSGNVEQFVQAVIAFIENSVLRQETGMRAKQFAEKQFTPASNAQKIEAFLQEICEK